MLRRHESWAVQSPCAVPSFASGAVPACCVCWLTCDCLQYRQGCPTKGVACLFDQPLSQAPLTKGVEQWSAAVFIFVRVFGYSGFQYVFEPAVANVSNHISKKFY